MNSITDIARDLQAEFVIQHRAGGEEVSESHIADFIARSAGRGVHAIPGLPKKVYAYYKNGGVDLRFTFDKEYAEISADGFTWDNPRVRQVGEVVPVKYDSKRRKRT